MSVHDLPAVNATLNAVAGVLLLVGFMLIRSRHVTLHRRFMLAAFAASALFTFGAEWEAQQAKQTAAALADPARRAKLTEKENSTPALESALNNPRLPVRVNELTVRTQAEVETRRAGLLGPQRRILEGVERALPIPPEEVGSPEAVREVISRLPAWFPAASMKR